MKPSTCCNQNCNQGRSCPQRSAPAQMAYPFAPGVIQGAEEYGEPLSRMETLGCCLLVLVFLAALVALVGFSAGYISLQGLLS